MSQEQKREYLPPVANLISFVPREEISTGDSETEENAWGLFSSTARAGVSFEVTDPDFSGWD